MIIQPAEEEDKTKVTGDIVAVLFPDHIKHYKQQGTWPFQDQGPSIETISDNEGESSDSDNDDDLFVNNNRIVIEESESESESEEESEDEK